MSGSMLVSRDSRRLSVPPTTASVAGSMQRRRPAGHPITCNRCRKPLSTTVFVCSCDCVFCEECTYNHFNSSSNCPVCNRILDENDFMELVVADPSSSSNKTSNYQALFTKQNGAAPSLSFQDLCSKLLKQNDDIRAGTKFLMKQFLMDTSRQGQRSGHIARVLEALKQEHTKLKQAHNSQRLQYEKALENLQQQLASMQKKMEEKERQLMQFRSLHETMTPADDAQCDSKSNGPRRVSGEGMKQSRVQELPLSQPPMKGFMIQREAQERTKQRALEAPRRTPMLGVQLNPYAPQNKIRPSSQHSGNGSYVIKGLSMRPYSTGSNRSGGIRNLTSSSEYSFSGGLNKRRRGIATPERTERRAMSPSQAFAIQPPGSYSSSRGPANFFQQQGYGRR